jgi:mono/diheme cytochrome c family protein
VPVGPPPRDLERGREIFQGGANGRTACAFCHTLRAALADAPFGPDLDHVYTEDSVAYGMTRDALRQLVLHQVQHPICEDPHSANRCMLSDLAAGADLAAVADFVSRCAANTAAQGCRPTVVAGPRGEARKGLRLYETLGCISCHWSAPNVQPIAPRFDGLYGSRVELTSGKTVVADDTYLIDSIILPDAETVKGFPAGMMSSRIAAEHVTVTQARTLVAYIKTLK